MRVLGHGEISPKFDMLGKAYFEPAESNPSGGGISVCQESSGERANEGYPVHATRSGVIRLTTLSINLACP